MGWSIKRGKIHFVEAASAFRQGGHSVAPLLLAAARRAVAASRFAGTGAATLAGCGGVQVGILAVLWLTFAIRFHCH